ncbi:hypothetical protein [Rubritalea tangerina]
MTNHTDSKGYFILTKHHEIAFRFDDISSQSLDDFIADNIFDTLRFSTVEHYERDSVFTVDLDSVMGSDLCGTFTAQTGLVTSVTPYTPN